MYHFVPFKRITVFKTVKVNFLLFVKKIILFSEILRTKFYYNFVKMLNDALDTQ